ncbi:MAG TPA: hypothetical protein VKM36_10150 [Balneolaceae bacterium]|nr:hypothetical protein [Balneolaceae bacterium]
MPNPLVIEEAFQQAVSDIEDALSFRFIYARFFEFEALLDGEAVKYQSYLVQLMDMLPVFTLPITWSGLDPEVLSRYADSIEEISVTIGREPPINVVQRLRQAAFLQYICVSEPVRAVSELKKITGNTVPLGFTTKKPGGTTRSNLHKLKSWLQDILSSKPITAKTGEVLNQCIQDIRALTQEREFSVAIPVVERNSAGDEDARSFRFGRLRTLTLHDSGESKNEDQIIRSFPITGAEPISSLNKGPVSAVPRRMAEEKYPFLKGRYYRAHLQYEVNGANHQGESSDVAISALWYSFLTEKAESREQVRLTGQAAITGTLNDKGYIGDVDTDGIEWKTRAAFFSWIEILVVPMGQYSQFDRYLTQLKKEYPSKKCILIGINSIEEIFYDRRLALYYQESRFKQSLKKLKKEKFKTVGIPLIVVLLLVIARLMYGPIDQNPVSFSFEDNYIELKNENGSLVKRLQHVDGEREWLVPSNHKNMAILEDISGDEKKELVYAFNYMGDHFEKPEIRAWSSSGDSLLWKKSLSLNYNYPRQLVPPYTNLNVMDMGLAKSVNGKRVIINANSTQYFQGVILIIDAVTGNLLSEYVHSGVIFDLLIIDRDEDGFSELLISGVNNSYWKAFVAEINVDDAHGYSPSTKDYVPEGIEKAKEDTYILLPKSTVAEYLTIIEKYNIGRQVHYDSQHSEILVMVAEGWRYFEGNEYTSDLLFHFDENFKPSGIGTSDIYDVAAREFYEEGKIPLIPDFDYFEALQDSILYWTGDEFVPTQEYFSRED